MRRLIWMVCVILSGGPSFAWAQFNTSPLPNVTADGSGAMTSAMIMGTGPYVLDGVQHTLTWRNTATTNPSGQALKIKKITVWTGMDYGARADVGAIVVRESDLNLAVYQGIDHYAEPSQPMMFSNTFGDGFLRLNVGDALMLVYWGIGFAPGLHADHIVMIWAEYAN